MGPAAHIEPVVAAPVDGEFLAFGQFLGPFGLEGLAFARPLGDQRLAAPHFAAQRFVGADDAAHFLLDGGEIVHAERLARVGGLHVVVEAIVGRGAEGDLRAGEQRLHRFGQHVGIVMPGEFQRIGLVPRGDQRQLGIAIEGAGEIAQFAVNTRGQRGFRKAGADRGGNVCRGRSRRHFAHRSVGQADLEQFGHRRSSVSFGRALGQRQAHRKSGVVRVTGSGRTPRRPEPGGRRQV